MKLTAQEEYGLRCILCLARAEQGSEAIAANVEPASSSPPAAEPDPVRGRPLTIHDVAQLEGISAQYAGKLIRLMVKAGLVASVRGCKGGYRLARRAQEISVAETLDALGSKFYDRELCNRFRGDRLFCVHTNNCSIRSFWTGIQLLIDRVLTRTSLFDLLRGKETVEQWLEHRVEAPAMVLGSQIENLTHANPAT